MWFWFKPMKLTSVGEECCVETTKYFATLSQQLWNCILTEENILDHDKTNTEAKEKPFTFYIWGWGFGADWIKNRWHLQFPAGFMVCPECFPGCGGVGVQGRLPPGARCSWGDTHAVGLDWDSACLEQASSSSVLLHRPFCPCFPVGIPALTTQAIEEREQSTAVCLPRVKGQIPRSPVWGWKNGVIIYFIYLFPPFELKLRMSSLSHPHPHPPSPISLLLSQISHLPIQNTYTTFRRHTRFEQRLEVNILVARLFTHLPWATFKDRNMLLLFPNVGSPVDSFLCS